MVAKVVHEEVAVEEVTVGETAVEEKEEEKKEEEPKEDEAEVAKELEETQVARTDHGSFFDDLSRVVFIVS